MIVATLLIGFFIIIILVNLGSIVVAEDKNKRIGSTFALIANALILWGIIYLASFLP